LTKYNGIPKDFDKLLNRYHIKLFVKRYKWFRKMLLYKCEEVVYNDRRLYEYFKNSFIFGYNEDNDSNFKHY